MPRKIWFFISQLLPGTGQIVWIRVKYIPTQPFLAIFDNITNKFTSIATGIIYPLPYVSVWKPSSINFYSIFTGLTPLRFGDDAPYSLGTQFSPNVNGQINKYKIFTSPIESGIHVIRLWHRIGAYWYIIDSRLDWDIVAGIEGWQEYLLPVPFALTANEQYIISVTNGPNYTYPMLLNCFDAPLANDKLITYIGSGLYTMDLTAVPDSAYRNTGYFRDIEFQQT